MEIYYILLLQGTSTGLIMIMSADLYRHIVVICLQCRIRYF